MKQLILLFGLSMLLIACGGNASTNADADGNPLPEGHYGTLITADNAISLDEMVKRMESAGSEEMQVKLTGEITGVCQKKGCWMTMKNENGDDMRVKFKDYGFFVPMDCTGKNAVVEGVASVTTTSVADLRHYAEDAGQSKEEIEKITEPLKEISFMADGVILK